MNDFIGRNPLMPVRYLSRGRPGWGLLLAGTSVLLGLATAVAPAQSVPSPPPPQQRPEIGPDEQARIARAVPEKALVPPGKPRRLLVFDSNVNYGGHPSAGYADIAFTLMGQRTKAFETVVSQDPLVFEAETLRKFDAVFFNNTVGNLFEDPKLRRNLVEFVYGGGGLIGVHGTSVAFTRWPGAEEDWVEFGRMLGARGANHRDSQEHVFIKLDDADHPVNQVFEGKGFDYRDEFFRVHEPYSRNRVRVLLSIDTEKTETQGQARGDCYRADNDYALAWVRNYGRGRVFYCTIAHNPYVFQDPKMLQFYLAATQFALGDLAAPTTPSGKLTSAIRAQEKLGWRLGIEAETFKDCSLLDAIRKTAELGVPYLGGSSVQKVANDIPRPFDQRLTDEEMKQVRLALDAGSVRLLSYETNEMPDDLEGCRSVFEFARKMGIETIVSAPSPQALDVIEQMCDQYDIKFAMLNRDGQAAPHDGRPEDLVKLCQGRSRRIGACGDFGAWMRCGIEPAAAVGVLGDRLITVRLHDLDETTPQGRDVPWGSGVGRIDSCIRTIHRLGVKPTMFGLEYFAAGRDTTPEVAKCIEFFGRTTLEMEKQDVR